MQVEGMKKALYWQNRHFRCPDCGTRLTASKIHGKDRQGHVKTMYCPTCRQDRDFVQFESDKAR